MLKLQPVGIEVNGTVKSIGTLSYAPSGGWGNLDWGVFEGLSNKTAKALAQKSVGRWYQVTAQADGTNNLASSTFSYLGVSGEIVVTDASQYLPLEPKLLTSYPDLSGVVQYADPYVSGVFYLDEQVSTPNSGANTQPFTRFEGTKWTLDRERGIVMFDRPVLRQYLGTLEPADLYLTCTYSVHPKTTFMKDRLIVSQTFGGTGEDAYPQDDMQRQIITSYSSGTSSVISISDNKTAVQVQANNFLATAANKYSVSAANLVVYRGTYPVTTDGTTLQVRWDCAVPGHFPWATTASQNAEGIPMLPLEKERQASRRSRVGSDMINDARNKYHQNRRRLNN
jgi:hypothetical protein